MAAVLAPVLSGSSYASQNALAVNFGLGAASSGQLDILWPGGVRNRLYNVQQSARITFPEIPCSYADPDLTETAYQSCLDAAFTELLTAGIIDEEQKSKLHSSALMAFAEAQ